MTPQRLEYDLDAETAVAAAVVFHTTDAGPVGATTLMRYQNAGVGLVVAGLFGWMYLLDTPAGLTAGLGAAVSLTFVYINLAVRKARQDTEKVFRKLLADPAGAAALGQRTVEFTRARLVVTTGYSREEYNWSAVLRVKQTPDFLILTLPGPRPLAIPRTALPAGEFETLVDDIRTAVGGTV